MVRRNTRQKDAVKAELVKLGHPTAEELYLSLKGRYPEMSIATVYRNLRILEEDGLVIRVIGSVDGGERFDATTVPHYHFICLQCGSASDIEIPYRENENAEIEKRYGIKIVGHRANFFGYCKKCKEAENGKKNPE
ncbi:MAG: transcriptional repressor [Clostridiales bacterium]|jgi:Fur family peroxide stress response transcriptional regulator|nr:transcriptional repressor [Clostridiales bacterium]